MNGDVNGTIERVIDWMKENNVENELTAFYEMEENNPLHTGCASGDNESQEEQKEEAVLSENDYSSRRFGIFLRM